MTRLVRRREAPGYVIGDEGSGGRRTSWRGNGIGGGAGRKNWQMEAGEEAAKVCKSHKIDEAHGLNEIIIHPQSLVQSGWG